MKETRTSSERNYNFDMLRILACAMVVLIHVAAMEWYSVPYNSFDFMVYNFYDSLARSAVPLFVMISGAFILQKKEVNIRNLWWHKILKLVIFYLVWSVLFYLFNLALDGRAFSVKEFYTSVVSGAFYLWFIPMIIGLYILSPIFCKITDKIDKKTMKYFMIVFALACLLQTIGNCLFLPGREAVQLAIEKMPLEIICQYAGYFFLGNFLYNYEFSKKQRKILYILGMVSVILCFGLTLVNSAYLGVNSEAFYNNFAIFTLVEAMAVFVAFKNIKRKPSQSQVKYISAFSKDTLGIYALHMFVIILLIRFTPMWQINSLVAVPIATVISFVVSLLITEIIRRIKFIGRWIV